jgi:hypothetical protein
VWPIRAAFNNDRIENAYTQERGLHSSSLGGA